jgi:thimet oligopeptidase
LHTCAATSGTSIGEIVDSAYSRYGSLPQPSGTARHNSFLHLGFPDYGSLYYCYLFSQVLSQDLFTEFSKTGNLMNKDVAARHRKTILEKGT